MSGFVKIAIDDYYSDSNWTTIINKYWMLAERVSDPRVQGWFLFDTPLPTLGMVLVYLAIVMLGGPLWMANRKPYKLQNTLVGYNAFQVFLSSYMFYEHLMSGWWGDYSLACQPVDYSESDKATRMLHLCWVYYFSKLSEFADTIFFVLRKKKSQITWLHLYHHSLTPFEAWLLVKFIAGGHGTFSNIVNNLVHVIMYAYYMVAAMGPKYHKYLWWKKHLTTLQLAQFFMVLFHSISALVYDCGYPKIIASGLILHSSIFIVLFTNFYTQAYKERKPKNKVEANNNDVTASNTHARLQNGHVSTENGHVTTGNGHAVTGNGHVITENGHVITENGHIITENGHVITENGHVILENGHATTNGCLSENGHITEKGKAVIENGFIVNRNGYIRENSYLRSENSCLRHGFTNSHIHNETDIKKVQ